MAEDKEISWAPSIAHPHVLERRPSSSKGVSFVHPAAVHPASFPSLPEESDEKNSRGIFAFSKPSALFIALTLMLLGLCFFAAGFSTGWWSASHKQTPSSLSHAGQPAVNRNQINALLEIVGATGGNTGRMAYAAQRALEQNTPQGYASAPPDKPLPTSGNPATIGNEGISAPQLTPSLSSSQKEVPLYMIQLGAYVAKTNALDLVQSLQHLSILAFVVQGKGADGAPIFYVRTGGYDLYDVAQKVAQTLSEQSHLSATVVMPSAGEKRLAP